MKKYTRTKLNRMTADDLRILAYDHCPKLYDLPALERILDALRR
ncbi:hypothetical protein QUF64_05650 [Anaerolineales bacterium HSG6]|nr:hypothetical protein [Anaerolineales bacterium HSG6]